MKKNKSFLFAGLAMLSLVFAMSCSNPAGGETPAPKPTPKPDTEVPGGGETNPDVPDVPVTDDIAEFVKGKTFTDDDGSTLYVYSNSEKTYTITMRTNKPISFEYAILEGGKVVSHLKDTLKVEDTTDDPAAVASRQLTQALIDNPYIIYDAKVVNGKLEFTNGKKCDDLTGANPTDLKLDSEVINQDTVDTLKAKLETIKLTVVCPKVTPAILADAKENPTPAEDLIKADTYKVAITAGEKANHFTVKVSGTDLKKHTNGAGDAGYWIGFGILPPDGKGVDGVKISKGFTADKLNETMVQREDGLWLGVRDGKPGYSCYFDITTEKTGYCALQWTAGGNNVGEPYFFTVDYSDVTLAE